jgi:hypothetical protein
MVDWTKPVLVKSHATIEGADPGAYEIVDTLMLDGQIYLVLSWLDSLPTGTSTPKRMLHVQPGTYEAAERPDSQFRLLDPIPKDVWEGASKEGGSYREADTTDIHVALPSEKMN